jgi:hypothetical protein
LVLHPAELAFLQIDCALKAHCGSALAEPVYSDLKGKLASFISRFTLFAITDLIKQEKAIPFPV